MKLTFFLFFLFPVVVFSQRLLTVEEAVALTLENNYEIRLLKNDSTVFALNNSYAWAAFLPRVNANSTVLFNRNNQKQRLADGTERSQKGIRSNNVNASVNLNWTLFDGFGMFATRERLAELVRLGTLNIRLQLISAISTVIKTYFNIVRQKQQLIAIEEQMTLNEERVSQAEKKLGVGLGAKPELLQARLDLNAQRAARLTQQNLIEQLKEQLNMQMAIEPGTSYEVSDTIPINLNLSVADAYTFAEVNNPALQVARQQVSLANIALRERKAQRLPTVSFNSAYNFTRTNNKAVVNNFTPLFNRNLGFNYGLTATIPILNGFNVQRQIREAKLDIEYRQLLFDYERLKTNAAITAAFKEYELQKKNLAMEEENILMAKENVFISSERFRLGISNVLELRESQRSLQEAYSRLFAARYNTKVAETDLLRLRGDLVK